MATVGTIAVNLVARHAAFTKGMRTAGDSTRHLKQGADRAIGSLKSFAGQMLFMGSAAGVAINGLRSVGRRMGDLSGSMRQSLAIMGDVSEDLRDEMQQTAISVAANTKFASSEAAEAYFFLASAGMDAQQSIAAMPQVAKFAQAGMFDLARATDLATDAQSAIGLTSKDAEQNLTNLTRVTDVLVKANTLANASVEQFSEALTNKAAAAARMAGKDIEEVTAVLAAYADQGTKGAEAGSAFAIVMRDLQTKALNNAAAFREAGVAVFDSGGQMNSIAEILGQLEQRLEGASTAQQKQTLMALGFSDKSVQYIQALIGMSDKIRDYESALRDAGGTTSDVADKQLSPTQQLLQRLSAAMDLVAAAAIPVLDALSSMILSLDSTTVQTMAFVGAFFAALAIIPKVIAAIKAIILAIRAMAVAQSTALAMTGPKGWALVAAGAGVAAAAAAGVRNAFEGLGEEAQSAQNKAAEAANSHTQANQQLQASLDGTAAATDRASEAAREQAQEMENLMRKGEQIEKRFRTPAEKYADKIDELNRLVEVGAIGWKTYERAVAEARKQLDEASGAQEKVIRAADSALPKGGGANTREGVMRRVELARQRQADTVLKVQQRQEEHLGGIRRKVDAIASKRENERERRVEQERRAAEMQQREENRQHEQAMGIAKRQEALLDKIEENTKLIARTRQFLQKHLNLS